MGCFPCKLFSTLYFMNKVLDCYTTLTNLLSFDIKTNTGDSKFIIAMEELR